MKRFCRLIEYGYTLCMGIAVVGATGGNYMLALGVLLPCAWMHQKNRIIDKYE